MANLIYSKSFIDPRGVLDVYEKIIPFEIKRFYIISKVSSRRGGHRHKETIQAAIAISGSCEIFVNNGETSKTFLLNDPRKCLILSPEDWHYMDNFSKNCSLLVLASELYNEKDYIDDEYLQ